MHDIYAPVARIITIRIILAIANRFVSSSNGDINEEVYIRYPKSLTVDKKIVCQLNKSICGLKK